MICSDVVIVIGYGVQTQPGTFRCVDCDYLYEKRAPGAMPPCPRYLDSTHAHAGWKVVSSEVEENAPHL